MKGVVQHKGHPGQVAEVLQKGKQGKMAMGGSMTLTTQASTR